jgi:iron(II)-dependent oxidoreductase
VSPTFPAFDTLLVALSGAGLRIGPREIERLAVLFAQEPSWDAEDLLLVLRALLVRTPTEADTLQRVWAAWQAQANLLLEARQCMAPARTVAVPDAVDRAGIPRLPRIGTAGLFAAVLTTSLLHVLPSSADTPTQAAPEPRLEPEGQTLSKTPVDRPTEYVERVPTLTPYTKWPSPELPGGLALLAVCVWVWRDLRRREERDAWLPRPAPSPRADGPKRLPMLPADAPSDRLPPSAARTLAWSVTRYVAEEPTDRLDIDRTVDRTARACLFTPVWSPDLHLRAVWLWIDEAARAPGMAEWAAELRDVLQRAQVPVRVGWFWQVPDEVRWEEGEAFRPETLEGARATALVGVLTDGRGLATVEAAAWRRPLLARLLRDLSEWPRLVFADFSDGANGLASALAPWNLPCVHPDELPGALGDTGREPPVRADLSGLQAWRGAMALCWQPVPEATGQALRAQLGLGLSAFGWAQVAKHGTWQCGLDERILLLDRLERLEPEIRVAAVRFWRARLNAERQAREADRALRWLGSAAQQAWDLECAFLDLWDQPERGASTLYGLHDAGGPLRAVIAERMPHYAPRPAGDRVTGRVHLPWDVALLPAPTLVMLGEMGMPLARGRLMTPGSLDLARGMVACATVAGAVATATAVDQLLPPGPAEVNDQHVSLTTDGEVAWTARAVHQLTLGWFQRAEVTWADEKRSCEERLAGGGVRLRCSRTGDESTWHAVVGWPRQVEWHLLARPDDDDARAFAYAVLDAGSADSVVLDTRQGLTANTLISVLTIGTGANPPAAAGPRATVPSWESAAVDVAANVTLGPLPETWNPQDADLFRLAPTRLPPGLEWSRVPAGSYPEGSVDGDGTPLQTNRLSEFEIGTTEVDNASYRQRDPEHVGDDTLPATSISWYQADAFCRWLGSADRAYSYRLPTNAEWEAAARGPDGRRYPWGAEAPDATRAVFGKADLAAVDSHPAGAGPFGTLHQAGNAWEWTGDWYTQYRQLDPSTSKTGGGVALRGGSNGVYLPDLVSADDIILAEPSVPYRDAGFRCVRTPRHQP